jgi:antitoxin ParD1/3/4
MNVILPAELQQFVANQVASGEFESPTDVVCQGLALLRERRDSQQQQLESLQAKIREGLEQLERGEAIPGEQVFEELHERNRKFAAAQLMPPK